MTIFGVTIATLAPQVPAINGRPEVDHQYPLVNVYITMENHNF